MCGCRLSPLCLPGWDNYVNKLCKILSIKMPLGKEPTWSLTQKNGIKINLSVQSRKLTKTSICILFVMPRHGSICCLKVRACSFIQYNLICNLSKAISYWFCKDWSAPYMPGKKEIENALDLTPERLTCISSLLIYYLDYESSQILELKVSSQVQSVPSFPFSKTYLTHSYSSNKV